MKCVHCGGELGASIGAGLYTHENHLQRCLGDLPYGHMGHPGMPCPPGDINPCEGFREPHCKHLAGYTQAQIDAAWEDGAWL